jgi:hypothetical protein
MKLFRGLLRTDSGNDVAASPDDAVAATTDNGPSADDDQTELDRERALLKEEYAGFDELTRRQLRYADRKWEPPRQGGEERSGDGSDGSG